VIALLAWDFGRRTLMTRIIAINSEMHATLLRDSHDALVGRVNALEARPTYDYLVDRVTEIEIKRGEPVDVTEFREALKVHEAALKNFWEQVQKTCATKDELKVEIDGVKAYSTATALSGANRFNRPRAM
jgi:hypothetical protein